MKSISVVITAASFAAAVGLVGSPQAALAKNTVKLENLPYSGAVLVSRAIRAGRLHITPSNNASPYLAGRGLHCTNAPCTFKNVQASSGGSQPVNETPIAVDPTTRMNLITAGNDYNCSQTLQGYFVSNNGGKTWAASCGTLANGASGGDGDPIVGVDLNGVMFRGGIDSLANGLSEIVVAESTDHGKTWSTPIVATQVNGLFADKPWLQVDTNPNSPFVNWIYVSSTQFDSSNNSTIYVGESDAAGMPFAQVVAATPTAIFPNVNQFSDLSIDKNGVVYLTYMNCTANGPTGDCGGTTATMYVTKSMDGGNTWSTPVAMGTAALAPDTCGAFYGCLPNTSERVSNIPAIGVDTSSGQRSGELYFVDYNWTGSFMQVQVATSQDAGSTWSTPVPVAPQTDTHDQFFPWLTVGPLGYVGVTWMDRRNDPNNLSYEEFGAVSPGGGVTYPVELQLSAQPSNPDNDGFGGAFMGDYSGNVWFGNKLFASWTDTSNGHVAVDEVGGLKY